MPSAALLRKKILSVLQNKIIPDLSGSGARQLVQAGAPPIAPPDVEVREMEIEPLRDEDAKRVYPEGKSWDAVNMHAMRFPVVVAVTEGQTDIQMGATAAMWGRVAPRHHRGNRRGGYVVSLAAPAYFLLPPEVPVANGHVLPWNRDVAHVGRTNYVYIQALPVGALCQLMTMVNGVFGVEYSLFVEDAQLAPTMSILMDEMAAPSPDQRIVRAQLLTLMLRLQRGIASRRPVLTDGLYSRFPEGVPPGAEARVRENPVIDKTHRFMQLHLHEPLNPAMIATHVRMTPTQLNVIMRRHTGMSVMGYVTRLRIETAQLLLRTSTLSMLEISQLVGFRQQAHFSRTFHSVVGVAPLKFRQQNENEPLYE